MPDMTPYYEALRKADAAGDTKSAQKLAQYIRSQSDTSKPPQEGVEPVAVHPAEMAADNLKAVKNWFSMNDPKDVGLGEAAGNIAGGAVGGAVAGAGLPTALKAAGAVIPGPVGKLFSGLGEAASVIPTKERMIRGAGGGAAMGAVDTAGDAFGLPKAVTAGVGMAAAGLGETAASFLQKEGSSLARFVANASYGNVAGASRALGGMLSPNKPLNEAVARNLQQKLFGNATGDYVNTLVGSENRAVAQEAMRAADPAVKAAAAQATAAGALPPPASKVYREKMYAGVTAAVQQGQKFSATPEFDGLKQQLKAMTDLGKVSPADAQGLLKTLTADKSKNPAVQKGYAEAVDDAIREWGKPAERGGQTGAAAVSAKTADEVRSAVRSAYNGYTQKLGLGPVEQQYRDAYSKEMVAQAKDELPHFLYGFESGAEFQKMARNLAKDPQGKPFIQQSLAKHLAQQEPQRVAPEFERLQKVLVDAQLVRPADLAELRHTAEVVTRATKAGEGSVVKMGQRMQQQLLMAMARNASVASGGAAGAAADKQQGQGEGQP